MNDLYVYEINELVEDGFNFQLRKEIEEKFDINKSKFFLEYPTVYIHEYKNNDKYEVYIGESNDIVARTGNHYLARKEDGRWQNSFFVDNRNLIMYVIAHKHFNKSLTMDLENRLINYMFAMDSISTVHNSRGNPQNSYYPDEELDDIFNAIWKKLRQKNKDLFLPASKIKDSAIFKASPLHKLTNEQELAKDNILLKINDALQTGKDGQLIFVEGEAGTGKTVLTSSTLYELVLQNENEGTNVSCCLMVNHDEQITVYKSIVNKLNLKNKNGQELVLKPTQFINKNEKIDIAFVDEGHLLLTRGKQSYRGKNQLEDIMKLARVVVLMFDKYQILTTEEYWEENVLDRYIDISKAQENYMKLQMQIRMKASPETIEWIDDFTINKRINDYVKDDSYEIKVFDSPKEMHDAIKDKAKCNDSELSRLIATYDWKYSSEREPDNDKYWNVEIDDFKLPWNRELSRHGLANKKKIKDLAWAEQPQTINEVGSTYTIQGFDLSYVGVIIGPSVKYEKNENGEFEIVFHPENSCNDKATQNRRLENGKKKKCGEELLQHELRVLMTRGVNGLYIYACDEELRNRLKDVIKKS